MDDRLATLIAKFKARAERDGADRSGVVDAPVTIVRDGGFPIVVRIAKKRGA